MPKGGAEFKRYFAACHSVMRILLLATLLLTRISFAQPLKYPVTPKQPWTDKYPGGVIIDDPYHWLENDNSPVTLTWVEKENQFTRAYLDSIPGRDSLKARMTRNWNFSKYETPFHAGSSYMYFKNEGLQNQPMLYYMKSLRHVPVSYFDINQLSADGTVSISQTVAGNDGVYLAFVLSYKGSDWNEIRIKEIQSMKTLPEILRWVKFSTVAWYEDGFFYSRYNQPPSGQELSGTNTNHKIYYHRLHTKQEQDSLVFEDTNNGNRTYRSYVTPDNNFLVISGSEGTSSNCVYLTDLRKDKPVMEKVVSDFRNEFTPLGSIGESIIFLTDRNASSRKIVKLDVKTLTFKDLVPEGNMTLLKAEVAGNYIICNYLKDATSHLWMFDMNGQKKGEIPLPFLGTVEQMEGHVNDSILFFNLTGFTQPSVIYRFNVNSMGLREQFRGKLPFNPDDFVTEQVFYESKDKTKIPMFLVYKKGYKKDGKTPTLVYGYGGFNISKTPEFKAERIPFLESGGLIALPNLRGGGEYGSKWHEAGIKDRKQNVFDDCIAAAEWLIKEGYTDSTKLALQGRSNGGLLVGAVMIQRPGLFKVALPAVGVMDMLRYHKFTIGWAWAGDYGTSDDSTGFSYLIKYSPYHNLRPGIQYPATLITTADHDDRVVPAHSFKFAARLQEVQKGPNPVLIRIDTGAGHGAGKPVTKQIEEQTDIFSFLFHNLGMPL